MRKFSLFVLAGCLVSIILLSIGVIANSFRLGDEQVWHDVIPGKTLPAEVITLLGKPSEVEERNGYIISIYRDPDRFDWNLVEVWSDRDESLPIYGILLSFPADENWRIYNLQSLLSKYGKPNFISWSWTPEFRFVAWTKNGIAIESWVYPLYEKEMQHPLTDLKIDAVFLFQPTTKSRFVNTQWPWQSSFGWSSKNLSLDTDHPDTLAKNPFGWILLP